MDLLIVNWASDQKTHWLATALTVKCAFELRCPTPKLKTSYYISAIKRSGNCKALTLSQVAWISLNFSLSRAVHSYQLRVYGCWENLYVNKCVGSHGIKAVTPKRCTLLWLWGLEHCQQRLAATYTHLQLCTLPLFLVPL